MDGFNYNNIKIRADISDYIKLHKIKEGESLLEYCSRNKFYGAVKYLLKQKNLILFDV